MDDKTKSQDEHDPKLRKGDDQTTDKESADASSDGTTDEPIKLEEWLESAAGADEEILRQNEFVEKARATGFDCYLTEATEPDEFKTALESYDPEKAEIQDVELYWPQQPKRGFRF